MFMSRRTSSGYILTNPLFVLLCLLSLAPLVACDDSPTAPTDGAVVTFRVINETFRVLLTTDDQIRAAELALGGGRATIPNGRIVAGTQVNAGYRWHLEDVTFAESTIELCDGTPSMVEAAGVSFGGGRYCPWSAQITNIDYEP